MPPLQLMSRSPRDEGSDLRQIDRYEATAEIVPLVRAALDEAFPQARQVWLGPEALRSALSDAERVALGLTAPLGDLLATATSGVNILVLDALERADATAIARLRQLIERLARDRTSGSGWKVVAIGQQAGFEVHLDPLVGVPAGSTVACTLPRVVSVPVTVMTLAIAAAVLA